jgi:hypothetical protein
MPKTIKILLAGVAVLFLATGTAHATDKLPDTITGTWCFLEESSLEQEVFNTHTNTFDECPRDVHNNKDCLLGNITKDCPRGALDGRGTADGIIIDQDGIRQEDSECTFEKIEQIRANAYMIYHRCKSPNEGEEDSGGLQMYEIIDGKLVITSLSEG